MKPEHLNILNKKKKILTSSELVELEKCDMKLPTKRESIESTFCTFSISNCWPSWRRSSHWIAGSSTWARLSILSNTLVGVADGDENGDSDSDDDDSRPRAFRLSSSCCRYCLGMNGHSSVGKPDTQRFKTVYWTEQNNIHMYDDNIIAQIL